MEPAIESASQVAPTLQSQGSLTKADWHEQYWFSPMQMITVVNPLPEDWPFMVELRHYVIKGGSHAQFPGMVANVYLDQMSKILAQNDEKLSYMGDPNLRRIYYDKLIVNKEDLVKETSTIPTYLQDTSKAETPPWQQPEIPPTPPEKPAEGKEFEQAGNTYKLVITKNGRKMYYKDGTMTTVAEYNKVASLL